MSLTLTWLGHACWLLRTPTARILVDPFLDDSPVAPVKSGEVEADFVLVTHGHFDHVADVAKIALRTGATVVGAYEITEWFAKQGVAAVHGMNLGGAKAFPFGKVKQVPAWHSSTLPDGASGGSASGFVLTLPTATVYFAGDTALFSDLRLIGDLGLDLAVLPIGDNFTMGPDDALEAVKLLRPKTVIPGHYDTWPPIAQDALAWKARVEAETATRAVVLTPGGEHAFG